MVFTSLITTLVLAVTAAQCAPLASSPPSTFAPLYRRSNTNSTRYIVAIHPNTVKASNRLNWLNGLLPPSTSAKISAQSVGSDETGVVHHWDSTVFNGLAGNFDDASLAVLRAQSEVAYVEEDVVIHKSVSAPKTQTNAPWGLSRLSSSTRLSVAANFNPNNRTFPYTFPSTAGSGVDIYIVDSGVHVAHSDFGGRATFLATFGDGVQGDDKDGHGTHVAGTAGGTNFGVAKNAKIFAVKVLDDQGAGPISDIISGLNLVSQRVANQTSSVPTTSPVTTTTRSTTSTTSLRTTTSPTATSTTTRRPASTTTTTPTNNTVPQLVPVGQPIPVRRRSLKKRITANVNNFTLLNQLPNNVQNRTTTSPIDTGSADTSTAGRRAVVNMSLGGKGHSNALDAAVKALVQQGVVVVLAAGNDGEEVGDSSPADVAEAITVGAMDVRDNVPSFSNFGAKVDVFAPGSAILSCGITSNDATKVLSGTSMSAPHITGLSALLLGEDPTLTPAQVKTKIQSLAVRGALKNGFQTGTGTQNLLAQNGL